MSSLATTMNTVSKAELIQAFNVMGLTGEKKDADSIIVQPASNTSIFRTTEK